MSRPRGRGGPVVAIRRAAVAALVVIAAALSACNGHSGSHIDGYNYGVSYVRGRALPQSTAIQNCTMFSPDQTPPGDTGSDWVKGCTDAESSGATNQLHP
jgi:hypothetical protein